MATYGEMIYAVLDSLKEHSDDAYYTEEHVLFFLKHMRSLLLDKRYKTTRNGVHNAVSAEDQQQICLKVQPSDMITSQCEGQWMRSVDVIPDMIDVDGSVACTGHDLLSTMVTFIPAERMPNVGHNKWLKNIIYAAKSKDGHLYLHSNNPQFVFLELVGLTGIFSDPEQAEFLSHEVLMNGMNGFDLMQKRFPLQSALIPQCIEMVVQELIGQRYAPEDKKNDAKDNLADAGVTTRTPSDVARRVARQNDEEQ